MKIIKHKYINVIGILLFLNFSFLILSYYRGRKIIIIPKFNNKKLINTLEKDLKKVIHDTENNKFNSISSYHDIEYKLNKSGILYHNSKVSENINILLKKIKKPLTSKDFIELREREELHTSLWHSIFGSVDISATNDNYELQIYKKKLINISSFLSNKNIDNLNIHKKVLATLHQSLYPWLYNNKFKTFGDLMKSFNGRGIVISTGNRHFRYARSTIDTLRNILNCTLPIEIIYNGDDDLSKENQYLLQDFENVYLTDFSTYFDNEIIKISGWAIKPFALLASRFEEVILLDADVLYLRNPEELFEEEGYKKTGTFFFRDRTLFPGSNPASVWLKEWMVNPLPETKQSRFWNEKSYHEMESSTVVLHKTKTILGLLNACILNEYNYRNDVVYKMVYGDKETFWIGFDMARQSYYMNPSPSIFFGEMLSQKEKRKYNKSNKNNNVLRFCGHNGHMLENGKLLYWNGHLVRDKKHINDFTTLYNFTSYYIEGKHNDWTPGLSCLRIKKRKANKKIFLFDKEIRSIIDRILERENKYHFILPLKK